jgi:hypothetical protein
MPAVVALTVIVTGCVPVMSDKLAGIVTLLHVTVVFVTVHGVLTLTNPQLVLLKVTVGLAPNPAPLMVTGIVVPAVHVVGETLAILTGSTSVIVVVFLIPVLFA